ncbi:MAG: nucleotidyltransferase domain-containing protein [Candidatus Kuenenbacteria bacterium]
MILFGSCSFGKIKPSSDIDMLIIKKSKKRRIERIQDVLFLIDNDLPFEPLVYTPSEITERLTLGDFFIKNILKTGKIVYEK